MTGEPAPLPPAAVAALLRAATAIRIELTALPVSVAGWHVAPGEWCIKETLGHIIETEQRGFAGRIKVILDGADPSLAEWDQEAVARERRDCDKDLAALLDEFGALRSASVDLVAGLRAAELQRGGHHPKIGYVTVADLLHEWVHHDRNHVKQMLTSVQEYAWPHMGATQGFYRP